MAGLPVREVWGVGSRLSKRLSVEGIASVLDLKRASLSAIRQRYGVVLEKTVRELNGQPCLDMEEVGRARQQIMSSRSFATVLSDIESLRAAVTHHVSHAAEKLRQQHGLAQHVYVMIRTNPNREQDIQYHRTTLVPLVAPTADSAVMLAAAMTGLREIFRPGLRYHKVGVMLGEISDAGMLQADLFAVADDSKRTRLMSLVDQINQQQGRGTMRFASEALDDAWHMRAAHRSPRYTTCWDELPVVYCC